MQCTSICDTKITVGCEIITTLLRFLPLILRKASVVNLDVIGILINITGFLRWLITQTYLKKTRTYLKKCVEALLKQYNRQKDFTKGLDSTKKLNKEA